MFYQKKIIQYNNLVFSGFTIINEQDDEDATFKTSEQEYSFGNGSYVMFKRDYGYVQAKKVGATATINMKKVPCDQRKYVHDFAMSELSRVGKIWAIENNTLLWANAYPTSISKAIQVNENEMQISVDFSLYEGVWHKADYYKTYLKPYDYCDYILDYNYRDRKGCDCKPKHTDTCDCECDLPKENALCNHLKDLQDFYTCNSPYQIIEDCGLANKYFGRVRGEQICSDNCDGVIVGTLYSDTIIPTNDVRITIVGEMENPEIEINGNVNMYEGTYKGLVIEPNGEAYELGDTENCAIDISNIVVGEYNNFGFEIRPRENKIIVRTGKQCKACVYIDVSALTI